jgi:hypothetical protein
MIRFVPFAALSAGVVMLASCATEANRVARSGEDAGYMVLGLGAYDSAGSYFLDKCPDSGCD